MWTKVKMARKSIGGVVVQPRLLELAYTPIKTTRGAKSPYGLGAGGGSKPPHGPERFSIPLWQVMPDHRDEKKH
jgi:hypothetical protein